MLGVERTSIANRELKSVTRGHVTIGFNGSPNLLVSKLKTCAALLLSHAMLRYYDVILVS